MANNNYESSFHGTMDEIPNISVDNFEDPFKIAYFLSHVHTDHTHGLNDRNNVRALRENGSKIYMTKESKIILSYKQNFDLIEELVEILKVGMTYTIDFPGTLAFEVTLIPVKHMVGAVMFLFQTLEKTILFTGDFIIDRGEIRDLKKLHDKNGIPLHLNTMYVDSTFNTPEYEAFPSRIEGQNAVKDLVEEWLDKNRDNGVAIIAYYQFGYEDIYIKLKDALDMDIFLNSNRTIQIYDELYGEENPLTRNSYSKIHLCQNKGAPTSSHDNCGVSTNLNYIHIYMSARKGYGYQPGFHNALVAEGRNSYYLCYPTHCSRNQLNEFKNYFSPDRVVPFPRTPMTTPNQRTPYSRDRPSPQRPANADSVKRRHLF